jgi:hypothetical protein
LGQAAAPSIRHLLATGRHAYHFFAAISFITSISVNAGAKMHRLAGVKVRHG